MKKIDDEFIFDYSMNLSDFLLNSEIFKEKRSFYNVYHNPLEGIKNSHEYHIIDIIHDRYIKYLFVIANRAFYDNYKENLKKELHVTLEQFKDTAIISTNSYEMVEVIKNDLYYIELDDLKKLMIMRHKKNNYEEIVKNIEQFTKDFFNDILFIKKENFSKELNLELENKKQTTKIKI